MLPWRLSCLGYPALIAPDGRAIRLRTRKHMAVLIYLALEPSRPHRRDRLASMLWPRVGMEEARHSLATALSILRAHLGADAFDASRETVRLLPGKVVTDVSGLSAPSAYGGTISISPLLDEFDIPSAPDFSTWIDAERSRVLPLIHTYAAEKISDARRAGDLRQMASLTDQLITLDPLSEHAIRAAMEIAVLSGDRIGAIRAYERWSRRLSEELGAVPTFDIEQFVRRLRRSGVHRSRENTRAQASPSLSRSLRDAFIGRSSEYRECFDLWQKTVNGSPSQLVITGIDGIGKTTLVEQLSTAVSLTGASVVIARCYDIEREVPFALVADIVGQLLDLPGSAATPPTHLSSLGRIVNSVWERWPNLPRPIDMPPEGVRLQLTEALIALITSVADEHPLLMIVDDVHLADVASIAVMHLALRRAELAQMMTVLTVVPSESTDSVRALTLADSVDADTSTIELHELPDHIAHAIIDRHFSDDIDPGPSIRRAIIRGARGVPMIIDMLVNDWRARGTESLIFALTSMSQNTGTVKDDRISTLVNATLSRLDADTRSVSDMSAVVGRRLNDVRIYSIVDLPVSRVIRAMNTLVQERIFRDAGEFLEHTNDVVRAQCYMAIPQYLRRQLHAQVASYILREHDRDGTIDGLEVAWHLVKADRREAAIPYLLTGGQEAIRNGAPHEADLALSTALPSLRGSERHAAILLLSEAYHELGRWQQALTLLTTSSDSWSTDDSHRRDILTVISQRFMGTLSQASLPDVVERLAMIASLDTTHDTRLAALTAIPYIQSQSKHSQGWRDFERAIDSFSGVTLSPYHQLQYHLARAWLYAEKLLLDNATRDLNSGRRIAFDYGFRSSVVVRTHIGISAMLAANGRYADSRASLLDALKMAEQIGNRVHVAICAAGLAVASGRLGISDEQIRWSREVLSALPQDDWSMASLAALHELSMGLLSQNRITEALHQCNDLARRCRRSCPAWAVQTSQLMRADIFWLTSRKAKAMRCASHALSLSDGEPLISDTSGPYARWLAMTCHVGSSPDIALSTLVSGPLSERKMHKKDHAEWLAAIAYLHRATGAHDVSAAAQLDAELQDLGNPMRSRLADLGLLSDSLAV